MNCPPGNWPVSEMPTGIRKDENGRTTARPNLVGACRAVAGSEAASQPNNKFPSMLALIHPGAFASATRSHDATSRGSLIPRRVFLTVRAHAGQPSVEPDPRVWIVAGTPKTLVTCFRVKLLP